MNHSVKIVHELPNRLRVKLSLLKEYPKLDKTYLEIYFTQQAGIRTVRLNPYAATIILDYDGRMETKTAFLQACQSLTPENCPQYAMTIAPRNPPDIGRVLISGLTLLITPWLKPPFKALLTYFMIAPTLGKAAHTLLQEGIKVEVLDGLAVGLAAWRGSYFTAMTTNSLLALGEYLQEKTDYQSDALLRHLLHPLPSKAWVERDGTFIEIPSDHITEGDVVMISVGDMIPVDGKVIEGIAEVNQASLTGENIPVRKEIGDRVMSGTVLESGRLKIQARRVGENTTTSRIRQFIEESLNKRSSAQCVAETLADQRVLYTLGLGGLVYVLTRDWQRVAAVFLVDYACAIKLGTPVAIKSAMYRGATHGVLFRGGQAIENLQQADTLIFDKTGTLTTGLLETTDVISFDERKWTKEQLLALAASVEEHTTHPIAEAVVQTAKEAHLKHRDHEDVDYLVAHGLTTQMEGQHLIVGSRHFLTEHHRISLTKYNKLIKSLESEGKTLLYLALEKQAIGVIALRDHLRAETPAVLAKLRQLGFERFILLTGDQKDKALALAEQLKMDDVYYECVPESKAKVVKELQAKGYRVAFVGDGVNDAPALISAHVGIAMPRGADLARATASIVLLADHLETLLYAKELSNKTVEMIEQHFVISTAANSMVALGAAMGWLSPISTALLHNGSTIAVLLNSLSGVSLKHSRLEEWKEKLNTLYHAIEAE
ncbi:heavy metal translocating P-type ATPase [Thioflexithrix psekupsensis]|uniref:P-type Zn(2+) transporter n=1 Tax=Thioflexithrix psekupsensis TaxID=1570016 RepID=A0A251XB54_9GAMM|nr:heavy metal translocating P-type ATPase [Thioflexithrix psekupsensis]OUD15026.1 ATPase P [Thioflexithrix psekupsensis]